MTKIIEIAHMLGMEIAKSEEIAELEYNSDGDISQNYMKMLDKTK